ncbi:RluA family pseudouridine synthase [Legionella sp. W05-934-2]|uniref:RluA family pseudouridine synthase n=1 Tax=Legionella sp. W05-934-2 TaxID=1198649 RepID=UPI003462C93C
MNQPDKSVSLTVDEQGHGCRIDQWIVNNQPQFSRNYWADQIKSGNVLLNDQTCLPKSKLKIDDSVFIKESCFTPKIQLDNIPQSIQLDIIYEDDQILVINKPAGLVIHPGAGNSEFTLLNGLLAYYKESANLPRAGIVHRLDKNTTGIMVIAKTLESYNSLVQQLQQRIIKREYKALVYGHIISGGCIETFYGRHPKNRLKMAVLVSGKEAITHYTVDKQFQHFTLLNVQLETGRTHQIRVHMAHIGHPIIGDTLYGYRLKLPPKHSDLVKNHLQAFKRQALHAFRLTLEHPSSKQTLTWMAPIPDDLKSLICAIEANYNDNYT